MKIIRSKRGALVYLRRLITNCVASLIVATLTAQTPEKLANPVTIDDNGTVQVPAQSVPPSAYLSPQAKADVTQHLRDMQSPPPSRGGNGVPGFMQPYLERQEILYFTETSDTKIAGVHSVIYAPKDGISAQDKDRVLIELHGGGFSGCWPGCAELESIPIASLGHKKVVAVDYREGPDHKFPSASEDVASVYREVLKTHRSENIGAFGCSAGGMLTAMSVAWFQTHNLPRPGAIGIYCAGTGTPSGVGFMGGDAAYTAIPLGEARISSSSVARNASRSPVLGYFEGIDPADPLVNPVNSAEVLSKFPPALIITGTRDFAMSGALYTHSHFRKQESMPNFTYGKDFFTASSITPMCRNRKRPMT